MDNRQRIKTIEISGNNPGELYEDFNYNPSRRTAIGEADYSKRLFLKGITIDGHEAKAELNLQDGNAKDQSQWAAYCDSMHFVGKDFSRNALFSLSGIINIDAASVEAIQEKIRDGFPEDFKISISGFNDNQVIKQDNKWGPIIQDALNLRAIKSFSNLTFEHIPDSTVYRFSLYGFEIDQESISFVGPEEASKQAKVSTQNIKK